MLLFRLLGLWWYLTTRTKRILWDTVFFNEAGAFEAGLGERGVVVDEVGVFDDGVVKLVWRSAGTREVFLDWFFNNGSTLPVIKRFLLPSRLLETRAALRSLYNLLRYRLFSPLRPCLLLFIKILSINLLFNIRMRPFQMTLLSFMHFLF